MNFCFLFFGILNPEPPATVAQARAEKRTIQIYLDKFDNFFDKSAENWQHWRLLYRWQFMEIIR